MPSFDWTSLKRWVGPAAGALALAGLLAALSTAVLGAFDNGAQAPEVIHRTARPETPTRTPTLSPTPTITLTPSQTSTPTQTPTPFPEKDPAELGNTVIIGGSTGSESLDPHGVSYVPLFDGGVSGSFAGAGHVVLPGALTHLSVRLTGDVLAGDAYEFTIVLNGKKTSVRCEVPSKGKGDFCESGDKEGDCADVRHQSNVAVQAVPLGNSTGQAAGNGKAHVQMSWMAKLDLYGECPGDSPALIGKNSCQGIDACDDADGRIGDNSCNGRAACLDMSGVVGTGSCVSDYACLEQQGAIGNNSCIGLQACAVNFGDIGDSSCNNEAACIFNVGKVGAGSCNGYNACIGNFLSIGKNQCNTAFACQGPI